MGWIVGKFLETWMSESIAEGVGKSIMWRMMISGRLDF
jgi:hypothetical protein